MDKAPIFKFTTNVPVTTDIRFVDVRPGKPYDGKMLPPQVSIKGTFDGVQTIAYLKGKVWANIKALVAGGVIAPEWAERTDELEAVTEAVSIPVLNGAVTATLRKMPSDKWENMVFGEGAANVHTSKRLTAEQASKPLPFDEDPYANSGPIHPARVPQAEPDYPPSWDDVPPPDDQPESPKGIAPKSAKRKEIADDYLGLLRYVSDHSTLTDQQVIQNAAATIFIQWKNAGLV